MIYRFNPPLARWVHSAFRICGYTGLALGTCAAFVLGWHSQLSLGVILLMVLAGSAASFIVQIATQALVGGERWVFYHHALAVAGAIVLLLRGLRQPVLPYLDIAAVSLAVLLACGRAGCFLVGCCHGRPSDWGIRYGAKHVGAGFPSDLAGVYLLPVQAVEGMWVFVVATVGGVMIWHRTAPGSSLSWCLIAYGGARFIFEYWRGDRDRPYPWGLSEAQWTSLLLVAFTTACQLTHWLPFTRWQVAAVLAWAAVVAAISLRQRYRPALRRLFRPNHVRELAFALDHLAAWRRLRPADAACVRLEQTSEGIRISASRVTAPEGAVLLYTLSNAEGEMDAVTARALTCLIARLRHADFRIGVVAQRPGIFHLILGPDVP